MASYDVASNICQALPFEAVREDVSAGGDEAGVQEVRQLARHPMLGPLREGERRVIVRAPLGAASVGLLLLLLYRCTMLLLLLRRRLPSLAAVRGE